MCTETPNYLRDINYWSNRIGHTEYHCGVLWLLITLQLYKLYTSLILTSPINAFCCFWFVMRWDNIRRHLNVSEMKNIIQDFSRYLKRLSGGVISFAASIINLLDDRWEIRRLDRLTLVDLSFSLVWLVSKTLLAECKGGLIRTWYYHLHNWLFVE